MIIDKLLSGKKEEKKDEKKDSTEKKKVEKLKLDLDNRDNRIARLTKSSGSFSDYYLSEDGSKLYYITPLESGSGLCVLDKEDRSVRVIVRGVSGRIIPSPDNQDLYIYSGSQITKVNVNSISHSTPFLLFP